MDLSVSNSRRFSVHKVCIDMKVLSDTIAGEKLLSTGRLASYRCWSESVAVVQMLVTKWWSDTSQSRRRATASQEAGVLLNQRLSIFQHYL